jgi:large-conductance mechanosensitive channel
MAADRNPPPLPSERSFGILFAVVSAIAAAAFAWYGHRAAAGASLAAAAVLAALAAAAPRALALPNRLWFRFGLLLHAVVSPIVLGAIFFLVITPMAIVMRLAGRDALERRRDPARESYWKDRNPPGPPPDSFRNQF